MFRCVLCQKDKENLVTGLLKVNFRGNLLPCQEYEYRIEPICVRQGTIGFTEVFLGGRRPRLRPCILADP